MTTELDTITTGGAPVPHRRNLSAEALDLIAGHLSPATRRAYASDLAQVPGWLGAAGYVEPVADDTENAEGVAAFATWRATTDPATVVEYVTAHAETLRPSTLARRVAALAKLHASASATTGAADTRPTRDPAVSQALSGARRAYVERVMEDPTAKAVRQAAPFLLADLYAVVDSIDTSTLRGLRDRALLLVGWWGGFRRSELVALNVEDTERTSWGLRLTVRRSKTDQYAEGASKDLNAEGGPYCPVAALVEWLTVANITEGAMFRQVTRGDALAAPRLGGQAVGRVLRDRIEAAGIDPAGFTAHSLRAGYVTQGRRNGVAFEDLAQVTGHRSLAVMAGYDRGLSASSRAPRLVAG